MYFRVKKPMKIGGKVYRPCNSYKLPQALTNTVEKLVSDGVAEKFEEKKFFQNGKPIEKSEVTPAKEEIKDKKKVKKADKEDTTDLEPVSDTEGF